MDTALFETLGQIAGIGGIALGVLLLLFRDVIRRNIFPNLTRDQAYKIIRLVLVLTFLIALAGIGAWVWSRQFPEDRDQFAVQTSEGHFRRIYYEGFSAPQLERDELKAKFGGIWLVGKRKRTDWEGRISDGIHTLCNVTGDATASFTNRLRYYPSESDKAPAPLGDSKVTVKVRTQPPHSTHSGAGLRFRSVKGTRDYYAFVLNAGNSVSLLRRTNDKLRILWSGEISGPNQNGFTTLKIIGSKHQLSLYVNDKLVHTAKDVDLLQGDPGIMAYSTGCFEFDDFSIYQRLDQNGGDGVKS